MKLTQLLLFFSILPLMAINTEAQNAVVTLNNNNMSVGQLISEIEKQTEYLVVFSNQEIDICREVKIKNKSDKVINLLHEVFSGTDIHYEFLKDYILLSTQESLLERDNIKQQNPVVKGTVVDDMNEPLPGLSISVKGTNTGTITDIDGKYSISIAPNQTLVFSLIGYATQEIVYKGQSILNINMLSDAEQLDEVVVVGYGQQRKVSVTGAIGSIKNESINRMANSTTAALQGTTPDLTILDKGGAPGRANTTLRIRGMTTLKNNDALLLVDGIEQRIEDVNPDDIENISILKDASTTAIYGSRAANGVVLITTKRGKEGKVRVDLNTYWGAQNVTNKPEHMETVTYMRQQNYAFQNAGQSPRYSDTFIQEWSDNYKNDPILS